MKKLRLVVVMCLCGFIPLLWGWLVDDQRPDYSTARWVVFVVGLVVIAGGSLAIEAVVEWRRAGVRAPGTGSAGDPPAPRAGR